jgi:molybdopterin adenylyltransferase
MSEPGDRSGTPARIGVLTISDRASAGAYRDESGPAIIELLHSWIASPWEEVYRVVADERKSIAAALRRMADEDHCSLIVTTGGTGPTPRDVTPEATLDVCEKEMPGFGELMRKTSQDKVPTAILSRQTAGLRDKTLIVNLPGRPRAIDDCLRAVFPAIPYCVELLEGPRIESHPDEIEVYRPPAK